MSACWINEHGCTFAMSPQEAETDRRQAADNNKTCRETKGNLSEICLSLYLVIKSSAYVVIVQTLVCFRNNWKCQNEGVFQFMKLTSAGVTARHGLRVVTYAWVAKWKIKKSSVSRTTGIVIQTWCTGHWRGASSRWILARNSIHRWKVSPRSCQYVLAISWCNTTVCRIVSEDSRRPARGTCLPPTVNGSLAAGKVCSCLSKCVQ